MGSVYLSRNGLELLKDRKIGSGTDADVYHIGNGLLYKIYHNSVNQKLPLNLKMVTDDSDMKIVDSYKEITHKEMQSKFSNYYDKDGVKLYSSNAIVQASQRQFKVQYTSLPKAPIYLEESGTLIGCVLKHHRKHYGIHSFSFLPLSLKRKILQKILRNVVELLENNIYHLDLANKKVSAVSHSNILLSPTLEPQIIDIDGKSAIYTENPGNTLNEQDSKDLMNRNRRLYLATLKSFTTLLLDFLFDVDMIENDYDTMLDIEFVCHSLEEKGLPRELSENLVSMDVSLDILNETLKRKVKR